MHHNLLASLAGLFQTARDDDEELGLEIRNHFREPAFGRRNSESSHVDVGPQPGHRSDAHRVAGAETNIVYKGLTVLWLGIQVPQPTCLSLPIQSFRKSPTAPGVAVSRAIALWISRSSSAQSGRPGAEDRDRRERMPLQFVQHHAGPRADRTAERAHRVLFTTIPHVGELALQRGGVGRPGGPLIECCSCGEHASAGARRRRIEGHDPTSSFEPRLYRAAHHRRRHELTPLGLLLACGDPAPRRGDIFSAMSSRGTRCRRTASPISPSRIQRRRATSV